MIWAAVLLALMQAPAAERARELWADGARAEAIEVLEAGVRSGPNEKALRRQLAEALVGVHRYAAALEQARELGREGAALRGLALYKLGRNHEALAELPQDDEASLRLRIDAAEALARFEESDAALETWLAKVGEAHPKAATLRGRRDARAGRHQQAVLEFERALAVDACDSAALFGLGQCLLRLGHKERALQVLGEHRRITPLLDKLEFVERAVDLAPNHAPNWAAVGDAQRALARLESAREAYRVAARLAADDEVVPIALRHARLESEDARSVDAALAVLEAAGKLANDARLWVRAGDLSLERDALAAARAYFERALALRPGDAQIQQRLKAAQGP